MTKDWVLPTGYTYLAYTAGSIGTWAKDICPLAAVEAVKNSHRSNAIVYVFYGKDNDIQVGELGGLLFHPQRVLPKPIGRYYITSRTIRSLTKKDWNGKTPFVPLAQWITEQTDYFKNVRKKSLH